MSDGWSFHGSIETFLFPMLLFIVVAAGLYLLYTKPSAVPGHRTSATERPVSYTAIPGTPTAIEVAGDLAPALGDLEAALGDAAPALSDLEAALGDPAADSQNATPEVQE